MSLKQIEYCMSTIDAAIINQSNQINHIINSFAYLAFVLLQYRNSTAMFSNNRILYLTTHYILFKVNKQFALNHHFTILAFSIIYIFSRHFYAKPLTTVHTHTDGRVNHAKRQSRREQ